MKRLKSAIFFMAGAAAAAVPGATAGAPLVDLRTQDLRLLRIADPIMAANASLCDRTMPDLGVSLQSTDQYPTNAQPSFAAPVAFAAVLPGSAAAQAGIARDDGLVSVDGVAVAKRPELSAWPLRDSAFEAIAAHDTAVPLVLGVMRNGSRREVRIAAKSECRAMIEILDKDSNTARSDGRTIQIGYGLAARATDEQVAVIFAHELAHSVLHHRERLEAAGAGKGVFGRVGKDRRLNLQAEQDADRLSVYLLANAGIDPRAAPRLWRSKFGKKLSGGIFHNPSHQSAKDRAQMMETEISAHLQSGPAYPSELLASRKKPLG